MHLDQFIDRHRQQESGSTFQLENSTCLEVRIDGSLWAKAGSMIGYRGDLSFKRRSGGLGKWLKKTLSGEGGLLMEISGSGVCYLADQKKEVHLLELGPSDAISLNGRDVLAFEPSVEWDITLMKKAAGMLAGGLFNMKLSGPGRVAFTTHGTPVAVETPLRTDPSATVAWSASHQPSIYTDVNFGTLLGRSSGETFQLDFQEAGGFVILQPYEEVAPPPAQ